MRVLTGFITGTLLSLAVPFFLSSAYADGQATYMKKCAGCHGQTGKGNEKMAGMLKIDPKLLEITGTKKSDADIKSSIISGQGKMPKTALSPQETDELIKYMRTLK